MAIDSAAKRRVAGGYSEVPDGTIDTSQERRAIAGYYSFGDGDSGSGTLTGDLLWIVTRRRRRAA